jgi:hypothetical protein
LDYALAYLNEVDDATIEVPVYGGRSRGLDLELFRGLRKCFAEAPRAVLVDLTELDDPAGTCVTALLAANHAAAALHPPVRLVLSGAPIELSRRFDTTGLSRMVPTFATIFQARHAVQTDVPMPSLWRLALPPNTTSAALAQDITGRACVDWQLRHLLHPARLITSELTSNAIEHAGTDSMLTVSLRDRLLHIAVRDDDPTLPRLLDPAPHDPRAPLADRGAGLRLVAAYATAWGSMRCRVGKVVWATLRAKPV